MTASEFASGNGTRLPRLQVHCVPYRCRSDNLNWTRSVEWDTARRDLIQNLERVTEDMGHARNVELAKDLSHAIAADRKLVAPSALLQRARVWLPTIDARAGNA